jgi:hypothetical protein
VDPGDHDLVPFREMLARCIAIAVCLAVLECGPSLTEHGPAQNPRNPNCEFDAFKALPQQGYSVIGNLEDGVGTTYTLDAFKKRVQDQVCNAGGDAIFAFSVNSRAFNRAIILKRAGANPPSPTPTQSPTPMTSAVPPSNDSQGCHYDTQCKGDRICGPDGRCVSPLPTPAATTH